MNGGRDIRPFIAQRVTESQSHTTSTPLTGGKIFICPFLIDSLTRFARRGLSLLHRNVSIVANFLSIKAVNKLLISRVQIRWQFSSIWRKVSMAIFYNTEKIIPMKNEFPGKKFPW
jgi:hypothetical protein